MLKNDYPAWPRRLALLLLLTGMLSLTSFQGRESVSEGSRPAILKTDGSSGSSLPEVQTIQMHQAFLPMVFLQPIPPLFGVQTMGGGIGVDKMVDLQTVWVRRSISWKEIEPSPGVYNWTRYDTSFTNVASNHLRLIVTIQGNPSWAAPFPGGPINPEQIPDYLAFIRGLVERYDGDGHDDAPGSPVITHWEFYNEPDNGSSFYAHNGWGYWGNNGAEYAELMAQVYPVVKAANPSASVLMGGIAYDWFTDQGGPFQRAFIDDFLAAGGGDYIDLFNFHFYPLFAPNWAPYGPDLLGKLNFLKTKLAVHDLADKPVAITEIGLSSSNPLIGGTHEVQSRYVAQAFSRALAADVKIMNWFILYDGNTFTEGLLDVNLNPKPAYTAYKTMATQLAKAVYQRTLSDSELGSPQAEGYAYRRGQEILYVVWTNDDSAAQMQIQAAQITRIDKFGPETVLTDGADGSNDGLVTVDYNGSPIYLVLTP